MARLATLRVRSILLVLLALLPAVTLILYTSAEHRRLRVAEANEQALRVARLLAEEQERLIEGARQLLVALARLPVVEREDPKACGDFFADLLKDYRIYANFFAAHREGDVFCSALPFTGPVSAADRAYFRRAVETHRFAVGEYQIGRVTGRATVNFAYPALTPDGQVRGVVIAALDLTWLNQLVAHARMPAGSTVTVVDAAGAILARIPDPEQSVGKTAREPSVLAAIHAQGAGVTEGRGLDGVPRLYAFTPLRAGEEGGSVYLVVGIPRSIALADVDVVQRRTIIGLVAIAALALAVAWVGGDRLIRRPTTALLVAARRLGGGDLTARTGLQHFPGELGDLARAFDDMAAGLQARRVETGHAEESLRQSEERFRSAFEDSLVSMALQTLDGRYVRVNQAFCDLLGYTEAEVTASTYQALTHSDDVDADLADDRRMLAGEIRSYQREKRYVAKDKQVLWVLATVSLLRARDGHPLHFLVQVQDITPRKRAEAARAELETQLRQAQKMEAVGQLAGGIAHDFNNLLTVIEGRSQLLLRRLEPDDPQRRQVQMIKSAADRAKVLTGQLLAFSRKQVRQVQVLDVNAVIRGLDEMLRRLLGEDIELLVVHGTDLGRVEADAGQLEQVILNLTVNARDAMPQGGRLTLETTNVTLDKAFVRQNLGAQPGEYVQLAVGDTGVGMDAETLARCFEPFFTTKGLAKGTGLGLATVYGIVKQHQGYIRVASDIGRGTTFSVYLPRVTAPAEPPPPAPDVPAGVVGGSETILLVEDEAVVRAVTLEMLQAYGYRVLTAGHPAEALLMSERHPGPIDILVTDVVMPGLNGVELADRLTAVRPEMKVLYVSGYPGEALLGRAGPDPGRPFLPKPYMADALARKVREVLDEFSQARP